MDCGANAPSTGLGASSNTHMIKRKSLVSESSSMQLSRTLPRAAESDSGSIVPTIQSPVSLPIKRFTIATRTASLSSGFPFHQRLYDLRVTHDEWHLFTSEVVEAAKLTLAEDKAAWAAGITTGLLSTGFIVFFGPVAGYYTGKSIHQKAVVKKVQEGLMHDGPIRTSLCKWNDLFRDRGFHVWLEMPVVKGEMNGDESIESDKNSSKREKKTKEKEQRRFRIVLLPNGSPMGLSSASQSRWELSGQSAEAPSYLHNAVVEADATEKKPAMAELPS